MGSPEKPYPAILLPGAYGKIDYSLIMEDLIDAVAAFEVYKEKMRDSRAKMSWIVSLQQNEALKSSMLEGTQATLDGVLVNQIIPDDSNANLNEVSNYFDAAVQGQTLLKRGDFDDDFFCSIHKTLLSGKVRKNLGEIGKYRAKQNYIGTNDNTITFTPPKPDDVPALMENLIDFMNSPDETLRPLVQVAIIHAQFETIHPFSVGNGRVGRMLIPLYLYAHGELKSPYFFISEALEQDKYKYYGYLMGIREKGEWTQWIQFFLQTVAKQCRKFVYQFDKIEQLYRADLQKAQDLTRSSKYVEKILNTMFEYPVFNAALMCEKTGIPLATVNRYLNLFTDNKILYKDQKKRNRMFFYYNLLELIR